MNVLPEFSSYNGQFVTPQLAVGACPRPEHVSELVDAGIRGIVNVIGCCGTSGMAYVGHLPESIQWALLGFWDGWLMPELSGYRETLSAGYARLIVQHTAVYLRDHAPLLIHCSAGVGRSGNLTAIMLAAKERMTPDEAIEHIRQRRSVVANFSHQGFWKNAGGDQLVALASAVLDEQHTPPELIRQRVLDEI